MTLSISLTAASRQLIVRAINAASLVTMPTRFDHTAARLAILLINIYKRTLSWWLGNQCLFSPTCSQRAIESLRQLGWNKGMREVYAQLTRCSGNFTVRFGDLGHLELKTSDGVVIPEEELSSYMRSRYAHPVLSKSE